MGPKSSEVGKFLLDEMFLYLQKSAVQLGAWAPEIIICYPCFAAQVEEAIC